MKTVSYVICIVVLLVLGETGLAKSVRVPTDPNVTYDIQILDTGTGSDAVAVLSKRVGSSGTSFALREVNCLNLTFRYMSEGDTMEQLKANIRDDAKMTQLLEGSISYYIALAAC